ncbi:inositol monophosphatase family protein [Rhodococcus sp. HNM0569]|uniref:inositol monophosphatase family protein n=1 Tax=Rhodococcus sp. HNM0569 TaxID=2716340 RepID=UPI00146BA546|nr:inositol monophosphatase family protein [Rhodococcus sp. HNM0569]NLU82976.1 inositol monophosphatase family protein [Rhodococcus sp. HNM0569]
MALDRDPRDLLAVAGQILDGVADRFVDGVGAPGSVPKGPDDFATDVDLELERRLTRELEERTGIAVHGEEFGGPDLRSGTAWVVDPIDGTLNYSAGLPTCGILLALVDDGVPILGLTWLPLLGMRFAAAAGGPLLRNGDPLPALTHRSLDSAIVATGPLNPDSRGRIPGPFRVELFTELTRASSRVRMHGSTGFDLALTAAGVLGGAVVFGRNAWDNAPGVALVRASGGVVTDLSGAPWTIASDSVLAAAPGVHQEILDILDGVRQRERRDAQ